MKNILVVKGFFVSSFLSSWLNLKSWPSDALGMNLMFAKCGSFLSTQKAAAAELRCVYVKFLPFSLPMLCSVLFILTDTIS